MTKTEQTPALPDIDTEFLGSIIDYSSTAATKLSMEGFKALWAERFFGEGDKQQVLLDWEFKVALSRTSPVYLTDENGEPKWIFPPIVGELMVGTTATKNSLDFKAREVQTLRNRFVKHGQEAEAQVLSSLTPKLANREMLDLHMFMIRRECGYLTPEEESLVSRALGNAPVSQSTLFQENPKDDDWDYE